MIKTIRYIFSVSAVCCALFLTSCDSKGSGSVQKSGASSGPGTVSGVVLVPQKMENIVRSSGTVLASESVDLASEVSGRIDKIAFREGAHVRSNDVLVKINDDDLQAQFKKIELQIQLASEQEKRQAQLLTKNSISKEQYDIALNLVNTLKADRDNLVSSIRKREIRSPFDGIIGLRYVSEGSYVTPATRIASIQKVNPLKVDFAIPEKYAGKVAVGDLVNFLSNETKYEFTGTVFAIEPKIDPATRTMQLRALCSNKAEKIFPGAYVQIDLRLKTITDALLIPTQAVIPVLKGQTVLIKKNGVVVSVPVETGTRSAAMVQIIEGLSAGDTVITTGVLQLRSGMKVNVSVR